MQTTYFAQSLLSTSLRSTKTFSARLNYSDVRYINKMSELALLSFIVLISTSSSTFALDARKDAGTRSSPTFEETDNFSKAGKHLGNIVTNINYQYSIASLYKQIVCVEGQTSTFIRVGKVLCKSLEVTFSGNYAQLSPEIRRALGIYQLNEHNKTINKELVPEYQLSKRTKGDYWISRDAAEKNNWKGKVIIIIFIRI